MKTYSLSIILDKDAKISEDLVISNSLYKLDNYIQANFESSFDVRKKYENIISDFCHFHMNKIKYENQKNHHNRTGSIVILEKLFNNNGHITNIIPIRVMYKNDELLKRNNAIKKIRQELSDDDKLKRLLNEKTYLLSHNEYDLIRLYFNIKKEKYKNSAISFFANRIKEESSFNAYYYCRHLAHLCNLINHNKVILKTVNKDKINEKMVVERKPYVEFEQISMDKILKKEGNKNV